jgi:hypothetical protein
VQVAVEAKHDLIVAKPTPEKMYPKATFGL